MQREEVILGFSFTEEKEVGRMNMTFLSESFMCEIVQKGKETG